MFTCASCTILACQSGQLDQMPKNCPMRDRAFFDQVVQEYFKEENHDFFLTSTAIEYLGYCRWPRLREVVEFAKRMGYTRLGITTSKKIGKAVQRNRARRLIKTAYRNLLPEIAPGYDIVVVARTKAT